MATWTSLTKNTRELAKLRIQGPKGIRSASSTAVINDEGSVDRTRTPNDWNRHKDAYLTVNIELSTSCVE